MQTTYHFKEEEVDIRELIDTYWLDKHGTVYHLMPRFAEGRWVLKFTQINSDFNAKVIEMGVSKFVSVRNEGRLIFDRRGWSKRLKNVTALICK